MELPCERCGHWTAVDSGGDAYCDDCKGRLFQRFFVIVFALTFGMMVAIHWEDDLMEPTEILEGRAE